MTRVFRTRKPTAEESGECVVRGIPGTNVLKARVPSHTTMHFINNMSIKATCFGVMRPSSGFIESKDFGHTQQRTLLTI
jgi:hypothetical protein